MLKNLILIYLSSVFSQDNIPIVSSLDEVLGDKYIKLTGDMCFQYDDSLGTYLQTTD